MIVPPPNRPRGGPKWRRDLHDIIFGVDSGWAKTFDVALILVILASVAIIMLESVPSIDRRHGSTLYAVEWFFTVVFTIEYIARLSVVRSRAKYATSFFGMVDLLTIIPTYLSLFAPGTQILSIVRVLRLLRIFGVLSLVNFMGEAHTLRRALVASRHRITVFLVWVISLVVVLGSLMFLIEGSSCRNGVATADEPPSGAVPAAEAAPAVEGQEALDQCFTSIPDSVYWAVVTLTTVGFGDITPQTFPGKLLATVIMLLGYGLIAVPTGIVSAELTRGRGVAIRPADKEAKALESGGARICNGCHSLDHDTDARFCKQCGDKVVEV